MAGQFGAFLRGSTFTVQFVIGADGTAGQSLTTDAAHNIVFAGPHVPLNGALGTPSSGTLSSCTGLPISTGVSGLGTGIATALATALNGSGAVIGTTSAALVTPALGAATGTSLALGGATLGSNALAAKGTTQLDGTGVSANAPHLTLANTPSGGGIFLNGSGDKWVQFNDNTPTGQFAFGYNSSSQAFEVQRNNSGWTSPFSIAKSNGNLTLSSALSVGTTIKPGSYTVSGLPAGVTGAVVYCSNLRVFNGTGTQQGAAAGTGGYVIYNVSNWVNADAQSVTAVA